MAPLLIKITFLLYVRIPYRDMTRFFIIFLEYQFSFMQITAKERAFCSMQRK